jgi:hypothetical protein
MQTCLALGQGQTPSSQDTTDFTVYLQAMLKFWNTEGHKGWLYQTINFAAIAARSTGYSIGAGGDYNGDRPVDVPQAYTRDVSGNDTPLTPLTKQQFEMLTPKATPGPPNSFFYDPQLSLGKFYPWPILADTSLTFYLVTQRPIADLAAPGSSTFDIPQEWYLPLTWGLAEQIMAACGTEENQCRRIEKNAAKYLEIASGFSDEMGSMFLQPNAQGGSRRGR